MKIVDTSNVQKIQQHSIESAVLTITTLHKELNALVSFIVAVVCLSIQPILWNAVWRKICDASSIALGAHVAKFINDIASQN